MGTNKLHVNAPGYFPHTESVEIVEDECTEITLHLRPAAQVTARVTHENGTVPRGVFRFEPLDGGNSLKRVAKTNGVFESGPLPAGRYLVSCKAFRAIAPQPIEITLKVGDTLDLGEWMFRSGE